MESTGVRPRGEAHNNYQPPKEIEVKYLVNPEKIPKDTKWNRELHLTQAYIEKTSYYEIRVRSITENGETTYELTRKSAPTEDGLTRTEETLPITPEEFSELLQSHIGNVIEKTRRTLETEDGTIEYDEFHGALEGLFTAEVEFKSENEAREFTPPDWFGENVTSDKSYKNANLALKGRPQ